MAKVWQRLDFWAIVIAVLALCMSGAGMYCQFFYEPFTMSISTLLPTLKVVDDLVDDLVVCDEGNRLHLAATCGTCERINLVDVLYKLLPPR
jgi:hypothetical protein